MELILIALATWRVSSLLVFEDGPFLLLMKMRSLIGVYYDKYSEPQGRNVVAQMLTCVWCTSMNVGVVAAILYWWLGDLFVWLSMPFAFSAVAIFINQCVSNNGDGQ